MHLPVTFSTRNNYRTELIDFDITHIGLPYNAILGYPALAKFMEVTHPAYNLMKMPGSSGVLTVAGDTKEALESLKLTFRAATAARSAEESALEALGDAPAKINIFSLKTRPGRSKCRLTRTRRQEPPSP